MKTQAKYLNIILIISYLEVYSTFSQPLPGDTARPGVTGTQFVSGNDVFGTRVFVENKGQFNSKARNGDSIYFALENGAEKIYFSKRGLIYEIADLKLDRKTLEAIEKGKMKHPTPVIQSVQMNWISGENSEIVIEAVEPQLHYMTYGKEEYNSRVYKKLVYRNIYKNTDIEFEIPENKSYGIKYSVVIRKGGDPRKVRLFYSGDINSPVKTNDGNILLKTLNVEFVEYAPLTYDNNGKKVTSEFELNGDTIGFVFPQGYDSEKTLIIDPWVTTTTSLTVNSYAYDVDYDYMGNTFIYGGSNPLKVAKYNNTGVLQWTFSGVVLSPSWNSQPTDYVGNFAVNKYTGKCYIGQGAVTNGTQIIRLSQNGNYDNYMTTATTNYQEIWDMGFHCSTGEVFTLGGGHFNNSSAATMSNLNSSLSLTTFQPANLYPRQDIASHCIDDAGNVFIVYSTDANPLVNNKLSRINTTFNGNIWTMPTGFNVLAEAANKQYPGIGSLNANGINCLAVNSNYLFYYDGYNLAAYSKTNGQQLSTILTGGASLKSRGGIAADNCNVLYLGGSGSILTYSFNGSTFTALASISLSLTTNYQNVFDIRLNKSQNLLYVCGSGFVGTYLAIQSVGCTTTLSACLYSDNEISVITKSINCISLGSATAIVTFGSGPFSYTWMPSGQTGSVASSLQAGTYTLFVLENGTDHIYSTSVIFLPPSALSGNLSSTGMLPCFGMATGTAAITNITGGSGSQSYSWSGVNIAQPASVLNGLTAGNYSVTVLDLITGCSFAKSFSIQQPSSLNLFLAPQAASVCVGNSVALWTSCSGGVPFNTATGYVFNWSSGQSGNSIAASSPTPGIKGFTVTCIDSNNCSVKAVSTITFLPKPELVVQNSAICPLEIGMVSVSGADNYNWNTGFAGNSFTASPVSNTNYTVTGYLNGCTGQTTAAIIIKTVPIPIIVKNSPLCEQKQLKLAAYGGNSYNWSGPSAFLSSLQFPVIDSVKLQHGGTYVVTVTAVNGCTASASASVVVYPVPLLVVSGSTVCLGVQGTLTATGADSYLWSDANGICGNQSTVTGLAINAGLTVYTVVGQTSYSCTAQATTGMLTHVLPQLIITAGSPSVICMNETISFEAGGASTYQWVAPNGWVFYGQKTGFIPNNTSYSGIYTLFGWNENNCRGQAQTSITVLTIPQGYLGADSLLYCPPFCSEYHFFVSASSNSITSHTWEVGNEKFNGTDFRYCFDKEGDYLFKGFIRDINGCKNTVEHHVLVAPKPMADFYYVPELPVENLDEVKFINSSNGIQINDWRWNIGDNSTKKVIESSSEQASYVYENAGVYPVALVVTNYWGCADTVVKPVRIEKDPAIYIPNAFTPNGDQKNDLLIPVLRGAKSVGFSVFNRWGQMLYETNVIMDGWDGTFKGEVCAQDIYTWKLNVKFESGKVRELTGKVTLLK